MCDISSLFRLTPRIYSIHATFQLVFLLTICSVAPFIILLLCLSTSCLFQQYQSIISLKNFSVFSIFCNFIYFHILYFWLQFHFRFYILQIHFFRNNYTIVSIFKFYVVPPHLSDFLHLDSSFFCLILPTCFKTVEFTNAEVLKSLFFCLTEISIRKFSSA